MTSMFVTGVGLWTPSFASPGGFLRREGRAAGRPKAELLPPALRRRSSDLTRAMAEAAGQALAAAGTDPARVAAVFASAYGETKTMLELLAQLHDDGVSSPIRFSGSVHNAASGYLSIGTKNRGFTTSLAAGPQTVAMALFEARCLLACDHREVLLVIGDATSPAPLIPQSEAFDTAAVALQLAAEPPQDGCVGRLHDLRREEGAQREPHDWPAELRAHPCRSAFALLERLLQRREGDISVDDGADDLRWMIRLETLR